MAESDQQRDKLLDLVLYAPVGLALTVLEDLPKLAEKGRERVEGQVSTARVLGRFALQMARQQLASRRGPGSGSAPAGSGQPPSTPGATPPPPARSAPDPSAGRPTAEPPTAPRASATTSGDDTVDEDLREAAPREEDLAIPGYESLSASQVVPRLAGLTPEQLEAVRRYELAHRHRRTVLGRIEQLAGRPAEES